MILLHAGLMNGRFLLWGETATDGAAPPRRRDRSSAAARPTPLPFAADPTVLAATVGEILPPEFCDVGTPTTTHVWLPTADGRPASSSPLIAEPLDPATAATLRPWVIKAYPLTTDQALALLAAGMDRSSLAAGVFVGGTLAYWSVVLRYAGSLVAREQFLPDVSRAVVTWRAVWEPILAGADGQHVHRLARAMPAACRAVGGADAAPDRPAADVLRDALGVFVDVLARPPEGGPISRRRTFPSVHDQWLTALRSPTGAMRDRGEALTTFAEQVHAWKRPLTAAVSAPFRLSFRLEEPDPEARRKADRETWRLVYLLQAQDDPSLLIPASDAWAPRGPTAAVFKRRRFGPREFLLATLGQAAGLSPAVARSLQEAEPAGQDLDTTGAHQFLTSSAPLLEQAGFGVLLPAWWTRKGTKQRLTLRAHVSSPKMVAPGRLSLDTLVQFDWRAALGDHVLTERELEELARLKSPLVQIRGEWVQVSAEEIQAALDFWRKKGDGVATLRDLVKMELGAATPGGPEVSRVEADGWIGELLEQLKGEAGYTELPPPAGLTATLRPYQQRGYSWLAFLRGWGLGACLADDMGLGKTVQTLALFARDRAEGETRPVLLVCPTSVVGNWRREASRFTPDLPVMIHHGQKRVRGESFAQSAAGHAVVVSSYALLHRDLDQLQKVKWAGVVLDEAQNIKNPETKQAQSARALTADYRVALTGTPVENHVGDLWSIGQFLNPGFLGSQADFRRRFFVPIQVQRDAEAAARLKRLTGPFLLRRLKTDPTVIADLPDKMEMKVYCSLTPEQATLYAAVIADLERVLTEAEGIQRKGVILASLSKLKQVCNHPAHFLGDNSPIGDRSGKVARLTEMLDEVLEAGDRALVFTQFTEMGGLLQRHLQEAFGREVLFLHGGVPAKQRDRMVARFQATDDPTSPRIFLLSLKAGGTGLNLTAATHVFHFDRWWNPAVENQATDRAFRIGQTRNVQVHKFVCLGTLEERIDDMIEHKKDVASRVVGTGEAWLTKMSNEELKDLLALRQEAVGD